MIIATEAPDPRAENKAAPFFRPHALLCNLLENWSSAFEQLLKD